MGLFKKWKADNREFKSGYRKLKALEKSSICRFSLNEKDLIPCLDDNTANTQFDRHYVYHPAWAARILVEANPAKHIDISSSLHFCSILSAFIPTEFYDYRPAALELDNLTCKAGDLHNLPFDTSSIGSISCMHTLEHIGLGRYGDPYDYDGDIKAINELKRVVAIGGMLLIVVPIGHEPRIFFNAHRVYTKEQVLILFQEFTLKEWALIPEDEADGGLVKNPDESLLKSQIYGCGCFCFIKR
jgi:hypothetical protein